MKRQPEVFYTSDLHIGHKHVAGIRGFWNEDEVTGENATTHSGEPSFEAAPDTEAHDAQLAANWDAVVKPGDTVYVLGDISINGSQHALDWIAARPGVKHLISGNHDPVHPHHHNAAKKLREWMRYFETIQPFLRRKLGGHDVLLSHFPYEKFGDGAGREGSRYNQYRLPDMGSFLLHGHTHDTWQAYGKSMHVGLDAWNLQLVPQTEVLKWVETMSMIERDATAAGRPLPW